jgi:hypothetical protein
MELNSREAPAESLEILLSSENCNILRLLVSDV